MRTLCFDRYGEPGDVLRLDEAAIPEPKAGHVRVKVHACGLNPADWELCRGFMAAQLPRGIGLDVAGVVDAVGDDVEGVEAGDLVLGVPDQPQDPLGDRLRASLTTMMTRDRGPSDRYLPH